MRKRGFVTMATGDIQYYKIAANLLLTYRLNSKESLPFAIIAEEHNKYTKLFDDVVIVKNVERSFMGKFLLLTSCPYDENIFFDADTLAYGDLNEWWTVFTDKSTDFSSIGSTVDLHSEKGAWYNVEDIWEYGKQIEYKCRVHLGVAFIRKSDKLTKMYTDCQDIIKNYDKLHFHTCPEAKDEATLGIAMPMNGMRTEKQIPRFMGFLPYLKEVHADMLTGSLSYTTDWGTKANGDGLLIHFGTRNTYKGFYLYEVSCAKYRVSLKKNKWIKTIRKPYLRIAKMKIAVQCHENKLKKRLKKKFRKLKIQ